MKYTIAKKLFSTALDCFYSKVSVHGHTDIPADQPVLFIANHNNAFIDPLLLTARLDRKVTFTAKNTLAKNPLLKLILKSFSVELLSRQVDREAGDNGKQNNAAVMSRLNERFKENGAVYIFPEGRSHSEFDMREFKTGAARLALSYAQGAAENSEYKDLLIVPLGLHYDNKSAFRSRANIEIGKPFSVQAWLADNPDANPRALTKKLKSLVQSSLDKVAIRARDAALKPHTPLERSSKPRSLAKLEKRIVGAPITALGSVFNAVPFLMTWLLVKKLSTDHDHPASASIVVGPPIFAVVHTAQALLVGAIGSAFMAVLYGLLLIPGTVLAIKAIDWLMNVDRRYPTFQ